MRLTWCNCCILKRLKGKKRLIVGNHDGSWMGKVDLNRFFLSVDHLLEISDGVLYVQENCDLEQSDNVVNYGHHMKNGSTFSDLCKYESEDFYQEHKTVHFDTLADFGEYEIVTAFKTVAYSQEGFKYYHFVNAEDEAIFDEFIAECKSLALYDTGVYSAESSPEEYEADRFSSGTETVTYEAAHQFDKQGRKGVQATRENISKAKEHFEQRKAGSEQQKAGVGQHSPNAEQHGVAMEQRKADLPKKQAREKAADRVRRRSAEPEQPLLAQIVLQSPCWLRHNQVQTHQKWRKKAMPNCPSRNPETKGIIKNKEETP